MTHPAINCRQKIFIVRNCFVCFPARCQRLDKMVDFALNIAVLFSYFDELSVFSEACGFALMYICIAVFSMLTQMFIIADKLMVIQLSLDAGNAHWRGLVS